jgi:hypothetical protein
MYLALTKKYKHWKTVECVENNTLLTKEEIFERMMALVKPILI